ncbi:enoyl-CoA hydratase [Bacillus methanolicus]|uniref:enoyl-CoA hydratase/isomerase family protein n=1 Tax=Bacillus methanolicus TaxID=1471 RepID=UPI00238000FB|nr:enoyl-CoA hydratase/isomerase family protein [Bacillus methanolicus]MDE3838411.1 enoyl-CoA hydratase [Bacillus methanolicus]
MKSFLLEEREQGCLLFTINRPDKRNAVNFDVMDGLSEAINFAKKPGVKALVITGAGEAAFCSGGDLSIFHQLKTEEEAYGMLSKMSNILYRLLTLPKPTIALINGTAVGGGCEIAAACDFRVAKKGQKAGFIQGSLAISTGWGGGTILFEKLLAGNALKILMESRLFQVEELAEFGFIDHIYDDDREEVCDSFLRKILSLETDVLSAYKKMLIRKWTESGLQKRMEEEVRNCAVLWEKDVHHELVAKFLKRKS